MASFWLSLLMVLLSLLLAGSYKLPTRKLLGQDGTSREDVEATAASTTEWPWSGAESSPSSETLGSSNVSTANIASEEDTEANKLPVKMEPPPAVPRRWEWKTTGDESHESLQVPRRKRRAALAATGKPTSVSKGKIAGPSVKATSNTLGTTTSGVVHLNNTDSTSPSREPLLTSSATTGAKGRRHQVAKAGTTASQVSSETGTVSPTTELWPWLDDESTASPEIFGSTMTLRPGFDAARPVVTAKGKVAFPLRTAMATSTTERPWLDGESTPLSETLDSSTVSTATPSRDFEAAPRATGKSSFPHATATAAATTEWPWLDDESTTSPETSDNALVSTAPSHGFGPVGSVFGRKGKASTTPAQANPPSAGSLGGTGPLFGKCLLAILLLALVAGIFIVITGVLATMLWHQKRAYKMNQRSHTEMVCISSLLATEEAEEAARRAPRVKRVKMLGENGSEAEMDNLTLNSFLPDH